MQRVVQLVFLHRVCLLNSNKHTAAGGHKQRRPGRRTGGWQKVPSTAMRPCVVHTECQSHQKHIYSLFGQRGESVSLELTTSKSWGLLDGEELHSEVH